MQRFLFILLLALCFQTAKAQSPKDHRLANQYYSEGEYEKAAELFKKLFNGKSGVQLYYKDYLKTLIDLKNYDAASTTVKKALKQFKNDPIYLIDLGHVYKKAGQEKQAKEQFDKVIKTLPPQPSKITQLSNQFLKYSEIEYAISTYKRGKEVMRDASFFNRALAQVYSIKGDKQGMISSYLEELYFYPSSLKAIQDIFQRSLKDENDLELLEATLLNRVQREKNNIVYQELLVWLYTHLGDYHSALIQAKSLDINLEEDGNRIMSLATTASSQNKFDLAIKAYQYVIAKGPESRLYVNATLGLINAQKQQLLHKIDIDSLQLLAIKASYDKFINEYEQSYTTAYAAKEKANLQALYLDELEESILLLEEVVEWPRIQTELIAEIKLDLGDYYLMNGEHWESTLLYAQVEKSFKGSPLGERAKFKNAKLSYYKGDFEWSQTQLRLLKASTDQLISNDAIDLSVFIADHLNLDTTDYPMILFAKADLYVFRNNFERALAELESLMELYPGHELTDDVLFLKGEIALKNRDTDNAIKYLTAIKTQYSDGILADDALFKLAEIYELHLKDLELAKAAYQEIILEHKGSTYTIESRKRFRSLRGDTINY